MEGQRPLASPPVKNWGLTITSQYAFLACLSSFMVRYSGVLGVEEPHQSIPNLVVKLYCGDDTVGEPPDYGTKDYPGPTPRALLSLTSPSSGYGRRNREEGIGNNWFYCGTAHDVHIDLLCASASSIG
ncbi:hypothetical protein Q3G72_027765 [Acer saccharum]|nr:hypothetical protein Q3G72_027432 [Acer saccharum]KAK1549079.1 hypothetical protein Q3G72_027765 [Acer saccharum]